MDSVYEEISSNLNENEKNILTETIAITRCDNKLRYSFFAMGIRELIRVFLDRNSSDEEIEKCIWYEEFNYEKEKVTRQQRMAYAICGGLSIQDMKNDLDIDISEYTQNLNKIINKLSKYVHINKVTDENNDDKVQETLKIFLEFINNLNTFRDELRDGYMDFISDIITEELTNKNIDEIDILATHYENVTFDLEHLEIFDINSEFICFKVNGTISVIHQYGSDYDNSVDDGVRINANYPVQCEIKLDVDQAFDGSFTNIELEKVAVDTSSFYE